MSSSPTQNNPFGFELVKIDKAAFKTKFLKFQDRILDEFRWTLDDLMEFEQWLGREDYAYKNRHWKEVWKSGAKIVGFDQNVSTPLSESQPAGGLDLKDIRDDLAAGKLQKPKTGSNDDIAEALFGREE